PHYMFPEKLNPLLSHENRYNQKPFVWTRPARPGKNWRPRHQLSHSLSPPSPHHQQLSFSVAPTLISIEYFPIIIELTLNKLSISPILLIFSCGVRIKVSTSQQRGKLSASMSDNDSKEARFER